jgi:predicted anti-sigma-YlaC factor YlaD
MSDCTIIRGWLPWYVSGRLTPSKLRRMASHIAQCEVCQRELAEIIRLSHEYTSQMDSVETPADRVWETLAEELGAPQKARIDVGSFFLGLRIGITAHDRQYPVRGDLRVLGRKVRIIASRKKGA